VKSSERTCTRGRSYQKIAYQEILATIYGRFVKRAGIRFSVEKIATDNIVVVA
jgi:hypothetical protein